MWDGKRLSEDAEIEEKGGRLPARRTPGRDGSAVSTGSVAEEERKGRRGTVGFSASGTI